MIRSSVAAEPCDFRSVVEEGGCAAATGGYKRALVVFGVTQQEYLKLMDFLRHHRLKPER